MDMKDIFGGGNDLSVLRNDIDRLNAGQATFQKGLNVVISDKVVINYPGSTLVADVAVVPHNLGYVPTYLCWFDTGGTIQPLPFWDFGVSGSTLASIITIQSNATNLIFTWDHRITQPPNTLTIKYYIFEQPSSV